MNTSAIILAGGESSRFGSDKSLLRINNELLIERSLHIWGDMFEEIVIVTENGNKFNIPKTIEVKDIYPSRGPLGGVHAGLVAVHNEWNFVIACDMPSIERIFILNLLRAASDDLRVILPSHNGIIEPLCGLYHIDCLRFAEEMLSRNSNCILDMYEKVPVFYLKTENCFFNINYPEDVHKLSYTKANNSRKYKQRLYAFCEEKGLR